MWDKLKLMLGLKWKRGDGVSIAIDLQYDPSKTKPEDFHKIKRKINVELEKQALQAIRNRNLLIKKPLTIRKVISSCEETE